MSDQPTKPKRSNVEAAHAGKPGSEALPKETAAGDPVRQFLNQVARAAPPNAGEGRGRLIFSMDATASREPTWDQACQVQGQMFMETAALGGLDVQLVYYRGFNECKASRWVDNPSDLVRLMSGVFCLAGKTSIRRVLQHAVKETGKKRVAALVFVGASRRASAKSSGALAPAWPSSTRCATSD